MKRGAPVLRAVTWLVYAFLYAPIAVLVVFSFNSERQTAVWKSFTLDWYRALFRDVAIGNAAANSLIVAVAATVIATVIGTMAGLAMARHDFRGKRATMSLLYLPVIVPEIVVGAALVSLFGFIAMRLSLTTVILAHVAFSISYVALVVRARLAGFDRSLEEAAMDLGANRWQTFWRVTLPLIAPGVMAGALLVFTLSIDDYIITSFVAGPGATTLPLQIYSMVKTGVTPEINAVSTLLLAVTVALIAVAQRLLGAARPFASAG
jgi:spermidine/putrescine transport system permease protein